MTTSERASQLAIDHWTYVESVIRVRGADEQTIKECGHHYKTSFEHAYGHAIEDERNGLFRPSIGDPLTDEEVSAISRTCSTCMDEGPCDGALRVVLDGANTCLYYRPKVSDQQHPRKEGL